MNKATDLKNALLALFRSGADSEHDETEIERFLSRRLTLKPDEAYQVETIDLSGEEVSSRQED